MGVLTNVVSIMNRYSDFCGELSNNNVIFEMKVKIVYFDKKPKCIDHTFLVEMQRTTK